jgi:glutamate-5-semialdehyde dehydrogenase
MDPFLKKLNERLILLAPIGGYNLRMQPIETIARRARDAAHVLLAADSAAKDHALAAVREALAARRDEVLAANRADKADASAAVARGEMSRQLAKRLDLEGDKYDAILLGIDDVIRLPDPAGRIVEATLLDDGLELYRVTCPIGVIGVIFESRPDAAVQISSLAIKSGNAVILKGGREAARSNEVLAAVIRDALAASGTVPADAVGLIATREAVRALLALDRWVDLIIPRGSNELVRSIQDSTRIPVLGHADGVCHVYLDAAADPAVAERVVLDAKTQYPAVCNAAECLVVHREALRTVLPRVAAALAKAGVELRADERARAVLPAARPASDEDWGHEFLDLVMAVRTVDSLAEAIEFVNRSGSHHTDAIVTRDPAAAEEFLRRVDSAGVFHNASTRFADGYRYGLGAEVGIATGKLHARGPVGLEGLVTYKWVLRGGGHIVGDYGPGKRRFIHRRL